MDFVSFEDLKQLGVPYSSKHLNRLIDAGQFPKAVKFGPARNSRRAWLRTEIQAWLQQRIEIRDGGSQ